MRRCAGPELGGARAPRSVQKSCESLAPLARGWTSALALSRVLDRGEQRGIADRARDPVEREVDVNQLATGLAPQVAREVAQRRANDLGRSVWLWEAGADSNDDGEEFAPVLD